MYEMITDAGLNTHIILMIIHYTSKCYRNVFGNETGVIKDYS